MRTLSSLAEYQAAGACIGTICAEFIVMFYQSFAVRKNLDFKQYIRHSYIFFIKGMIMFVIIMIIGNYISNSLNRIIVQVMVGGFIYFIMNHKYIIKNLGIQRKIRKENLR